MLTNHKFTKHIITDWSHQDADSLEQFIVAVHD